MHLLAYKSSKTTDRAAGFSLRVILHLFGDIHQPLHAGDAVDANHPLGDMGGNARYFGAGCFGGPANITTTNLHALMDSAGGK